MLAVDIFIVDMNSKMDLKLIRRLAYKCNTSNDAHFEARFKPAYVPLW